MNKLQNVFEKWLESVMNFTQKKWKAYRHECHLFFWMDSKMILSEKAARTFQLKRPFSYWKWAQKTSFLPQWDKEALCAGGWQSSLNHMNLQIKKISILLSLILKVIVVQGQNVILRTIYSKSLVLSFEAIAKKGSFPFQCSAVSNIINKNWIEWNQT